MRGLLHRAALALLVVLTPADVARAFTPTSDGRSVTVVGVETKTPAPFQPFDETVSIYFGGYPVIGASQSSSIPTDGIDAWGSAGGFSPAPFSAGAESVLDVGFDLSQSSVFSLTGSLVEEGAGSIWFQLERLAPNPAVVIPQNTTGALDYALLGLASGSYRLRAIAQGGSSTGQGGGSASFAFDFRLVCASASPQDSDGDSLFDACDQCPLNFDPGQEDTDGDGFGDACNDAVDFDGDEWANTLDNCPADSNPDQIDADYDELGDVCDNPEVIASILAIESFRSPLRVAMAPDGTAYTTVSPWIYQMPPGGPQVQLINGLPLGAQFADVAVGLDGMVYTAGASLGKSYRIHPVTRAATLLIGPAGDGVNALTYANRVAVAPDGRVFVSGRDSKNVFEIAVGGAITQILGPSGNGAYGLGEPRALDVASDGNLYVLANLTNGPCCNNGPRLFRVTPAHQIELVMAPLAFPFSMNAYDLALGQDGSIYIAGGGILVRRPSGVVDTLLPVNGPPFALAIDVDSRDVVHVGQGSGGIGGTFRIAPTGQIGPLIGPGSSCGDGNDVVVADGPTKRIALVCSSPANALLITDASAPAIVPLLPPLAQLALALALLGSMALAGTGTPRASAR